MIVYLDLVFLTNMLWDYILLWITGKILQKNDSKIRYILAAMIGGISAVVVMIALPAEKHGFFVSYFMMAAIRFLTAILMLKVAFLIKHFREMMVSLLLLYGFSFLVEGGLRYISQWLDLGLFSNVTGLMFLGMILFIFLFLKRFYHVVKDRLFSKQYSLPVLIIKGNKQATGRGLLDSGNSLFEPITQKPVVVVEQDFLTQNEMLSTEDGFFAIPFHALGTNHGILKGFLADEIHILSDDGEKVVQKAMIGVYEGRLSMRGDYQILLHPKL